MVPAERPLHQIKKVNTGDCLVSRYYRSHSTLLLQSVCHFTYLSSKYIVFKQQTHYLGEH